ncbi:MAG: bacterioferritin-associated ferredoxin [Campylobacterales bacterium]
MYICNCHGLNEGKIKELASSGASSLLELKNICKLGSGCGKCLDHAKKILQSCPEECSSKACLKS